MRRGILHTYCLLFVLMCTTIFSACTAHFGSSSQQRMHAKMSSHLAKLVAAERMLEGRAGVAGSLLVIFDTNSDKPLALHVVSGSTMYSAMYALMKTTNGDPCESTGAKPTIAAFAPPQTVDLPFSFEQCSTVRDEVRVLSSQLRDLARLKTATNGNRSTLNRITGDLKVVADIQDQSWTKVFSLLEEMARNP